MHTPAAYQHCYAAGRWKDYHWLDVRMRHRIELVVFELELGPDIDISTFVFGTVAIFRCGEDCVGSELPVL